MSKKSAIPASLSPLSRKGLQHTIRYALRPEDPQLLRQFLNEQPRYVSIVSQRTQIIAQFRLLLDTLADEQLPSHWRCLCLDHLHIPLQALQALANCARSRHQVNALQQEMRSISHYYAAGLSKPAPLQSMEEIFNYD